MEQVQGKTHQEVQLQPSLGPMLGNTRLVSGPSPRDSEFNFVRRACSYANFTFSSPVADMSSKLLPYC